MLYLHDLIQASKAILRPEKLLFPSYRRGNGGTEKLRGSRFNPAPPVETSQTPEAALDRLRQARTPAEADGDSKGERIARGDKSLADAATQPHHRENIHSTRPELVPLTNQV